MDEKLSEVLKWCNQVRAVLGAEPLESLPTGSITDIPANIPVLTALMVGPVYDVEIWQECILYSKEPLSEVADKLDARQEEITFQGKSSYWTIFPVPAYIDQFIDDWCDGNYPELMTTKIPVDSDKDDGERLSDAIYPDETVPFADDENYEEEEEEDWLGRDWDEDLEEYDDDWDDEDGRDYWLPGDILV